MRLWKVLGLAGAAGVAATGITLARRRQLRNYDADELRSELHKRLADASQNRPCCDREPLSDRAVIDNSTGEPVPLDEPRE